jgi:hypothetical protein
MNPSLKEFLVTFAHSNQEPDDNNVGITIWAVDESQARRTVGILLPNGPTHYTAIINVEEVQR